MSDQAPTDRALLSIGGHGKNERQRFEVQVRRLDGVLGGLGLDRVRLIKVDVEGYELAVLQGLGDRLERVENLILEFYEWPERRGDNEQLIDFIARERVRAADSDGRALDARDRTARAQPVGAAQVNRVLIVSPHFPPDNGAASHRMRLLAPRLVEHGWEPTVWQ